MHVVSVTFTEYVVDRERLGIAETHWDELLVDGGGVAPAGGALQAPPVTYPPKEFGDNTGGAKTPDGFCEYPTYKLKLPSGAPVAFGAG